MVEKRFGGGAGGVEALCAAEQARVPGREVECVDQVQWNPSVSGLARRPHHGTRGVSAWIDADDDACGRTRALDGCLVLHGSASWVDSRSTRERGLGRIVRARRARLADGRQRLARALPRRLDQRHALGMNVRCPLPRPPPPICVPAMPAEVIGIGMPFARMAPCRFVRASNPPPRIVHDGAAYEMPMVATTEVCVAAALALD
jgi:hypothetical protein